MGCLILSLASGGAGIFYKIVFPKQIYATVFDVQGVKHWTIKDWDMPSAPGHLENCLISRIINIKMPMV